MKIKLRPILLALWCTVFTVPDISAQMARLYTTQHGLHTNYCHSVDIDSRGFVWVSGYNMLALFDGNHFEYMPDVDHMGRQRLQHVYRVKEISNDKYWVCTSQGLYLLNARNMEFQRIMLNAREDSINGYSINTIVDYPKAGHSLVTTDGFTSFVISNKTQQVDTVLSRRINNAIGDAFVRRPLFDKKGNMWVCTRTVPLVCVDLKTMRQKKFSYSDAATDVISSSTVTSLLQTNDGLLIGTNHGLLKYSYATNQVGTLAVESKHLCVRSLISTKDNRFLVGTDGQGIWEFSNSSAGPTLQPIHQQSTNTDLTYAKVTDMKEDHKGNIIAVCLQKGLVVIPPQSDVFHYHAISPIANGKNATSISSIAIDKDKNYWVGTDGCGVFTTQGMHLATARQVGTGLASPLVQVIKIDRNGTPWVGTFGGGVQYLSHNKWTNDFLLSLKDEQVMDMHYDEVNNDLYVGTNGNGVFKIDIDARKVNKVDISVFYNPWVSSLLYDSEGTLWIGTSQEVVYYNLKTKKSDRITYNSEPIRNADAITQDGDNILIAHDRGLTIYNLKTHKQQNVGAAQGLSNVSIRSIATTEDYYWLATRINIASVDKKTLNVRNYSSFNGYEVDEFHSNSSLQPIHGYILFGGDNGIICFQPKLISNRNDEVQKVYFTSFTTPLHTEDIDASILYASKVELNHDNNSFSIHFSVAEIGDPTRIQYDYILEGHDAQWNRNVPTPSASYSSLPSGNYTFRVRAYQEDSPEQFSESTLSISVAAAWYASIWAFAVYFLILVFIIFVLWQQVQAHRRQRELLRKSAEQDRMKEAKLKMFTSIAHELRSPLTMIESPLKQLQDEDTDEEHQNLYSVMQRNCDRLLNIVKQITDIRKIDSGQFNLHLEETDYVEYANKVFEQFKGVATVKEIQFNIQHQFEEMPMMLDPTHFEKIITNLLSNAFKFTPQGGSITAASAVKGNHIELRFHNTGSHFNEEDMNHLWERFYQGSAGDGATGSGIGLNLVHELVKLHHGSIEAHNVKDGVEFVLQFPYYSTQPAATKATQSTKPTILIVDDDQEIVDYISGQLRKKYNVIAAFSGNTGWKKVLAQAPDVVITDYRMPDGNGMELCQQIKSNPQTDNIPVIMLTGEGDDNLKLHSLNIQVDHYLEKPVNMQLLKSAITQVLKVREKIRSKSNRTEFTTELETPVITSADDKLFGRIQDTIKQHLDNSEFSVQQLSEIVGISRVHLNRKMKERYGVSPNIFIRSFRLKQAASLLVNNKVNVSEVAYRVGFSSHSYFTTSFHDYFSMSPKEFMDFYSKEENQEALKRLLE